MEALALTWRGRVANARFVKPASTIYSGRSFREALAAAAAAGTDLRIISAGMGLIEASRSIPSYGLTVTQGAKDDIGCRATDGFDPAQWWQLIQDGDGAPLAGLVRSNPHGLTALGLTRSYASLVTTDLLTLTWQERQRLRIFGLSIGAALPPDLQRYVMPYDDRLDGPDSSVRGTRGDFASRALRYFVDNVWRTSPTGSLDSHKAAVERLLVGWRPAPKFSRQALPDDEIIVSIRKSLDKTKRRSSFALRHLRDVDGIACEQGRFKELFKRAIEKQKP